MVTGTGDLDVKNRIHEVEPHARRNSSNKQWWIYQIKVGSRRRKQDFRRMSCIQTGESGRQ